MKEHFDKEAIDSTFRKITENETKELKTHFVFAGRYYINYQARLRSSILEEMKKYKIRSVMVTSIYMWRSNLITKEAMEKYCKGEEDEKVSVTDDLELFFKDLRLGNKPDKEALNYFLPKLTEEEMVLVKKKDKSYLKTFHWPDPDVEEAEINLFESDSKFVRGLGYRETFTIENKSLQNNSYCCNLQ